MYVCILYAPSMFDPGREAILYELEYTYNKPSTYQLIFLIF